MVSSQNSRTRKNVRHNRITSESIFVDADLDNPLDDLASSELSGDDDVQVPKPQPRKRMMPWALARQKGNLVFL